MPEILKAILKRRGLIWNLVSRNLKIRYKSSVLGFFWSMLTPLMMILIYALFAHILKFNRGQPHYLQFLVSGIIVWQFTAGCLGDSIYTIVGNTNLVKKVKFPRVILPISTALADAVNFLFTLIILILYLFLTKTLYLAGAVWLFAALAMHLLLGIGLACICSTSNVFFRDTEHIVGVGTLAWFFLSPVFYAAEMQVGVLKEFSGIPNGIIFLNPMTGILSAYRAGLMNTPVMPDGVSSAWILLSAAVCIVVFLLGLAVVKIADKHFGDIL